jgi:hypothetical protein
MLLQDAKKCSSRSGANTAQRQAFHGSGTRRPTTDPTTGAQYSIRICHCCPPARRCDRVSKICPYCWLDAALHPCGLGSEDMRAASRRRLCSRRSRNLAALLASLSSSVVGCHQPRSRSCSAGPDRAAHVWTRSSRVRALDKAHTYSSPALG